MSHRPPRPPGCSQAHKLLLRALPAEGISEMLSLCFLCICLRLNFFSNLFSSALAPSLP